MFWLISYAQGAGRSMGMEITDKHPIVWLKTTGWPNDGEENTPVVILNVVKIDFEAGDLEGGGVVTGPELLNWLMKNKT